MKLAYLEAYGILIRVLVCTTSLYVLSSKYKGENLPQYQLHRMNTLEL